MTDDGSAGEKGVVTNALKRLIASGEHTKGPAVNRHGGIVAAEGTGLTSCPGVYAGGDAVAGAAAVIVAMGAGKTAAHAIHEYLKEK